MTTRIAIIRMIVLSAMLAFMNVRPAEAQWGHGNYTASAVALWGNYVYSAGANGGSVEALFPPSDKNYSECSVQFQVVWGKAGPPPFTGTITYKTDLSASAGTGSFAWARDDASVVEIVGVLTKDTRTDGNPVSVTGATVGSRNVATTPVTANMLARAYVDKGTGSSGSASAFVYTTM